MPGPVFQPAAELSAGFYAEAVRPLLTGHRHAAGLLGWGSDVLGYDTGRSTDHGWGPRLVLFLDDDHALPEVEALLSARLPAEFGGWPVRYGWDDVAPRHRVTATTLSCWLVDRLGVDPLGGMGTLDWLLVPQQQLLGVVAGPVFADAQGTLGQARDALEWYPDHVWRWVLACQWQRIAEHEAFVGRTAEVGDRTGCAVVAARLVRDLMRLALLLARRYAPYDKWLGTAFDRLPHRDGLPRALAAVVSAADGSQRESALAAAYRAVAVRHNALGLTDPLAPSTGDHHSRPAQVLGAGRFAEALRATVVDPGLRALPLIGAVDQVVDDVAVLTDPALCRRLAVLYGGADR
jgi:hypothetical protein